MVIVLRGVLRTRNVRNVLMLWQKLTRLIKLRPIVRLFHLSQNYWKNLVIAYCNRIMFSNAMHLYRKFHMLNQWKLGEVKLWPKWWQEDYLLVILMMSMHLRCVFWKVKFCYCLSNLFFFLSVLTIRNPLSVWCRKIIVNEQIILNWREGMIWTYHGK